MSRKAPESALLTKSGSEKLSYKKSFSGLILFFLLLLGFLKIMDAIGEKLRGRNRDFVSSVVFVFSKFDSQWRLNSEMLGDLLNWSREGGKEAGGFGFVWGCFGHLGGSGN